MLLTKKFQFFSLFTIDQKKTRNKAWRLCRKKETFFHFKKQNFSKNRTFSKGLTHAFSQKMTIFRLFRFGQNKTRNNATSQRKKKPFFGYKNRIFESPKNRIFSKGVNL